MSRKRNSQQQHEENLFDLDTNGIIVSSGPPKTPKANPYHFFSEKIRPILVAQEVPNDQIFAKIADIWCNALVKRKYERKFFNAWTRYYLRTAKWIEEHPEEANKIMEEERREIPDKKKRKKKMEDEQESISPFRNTDPNSVRHMIGPSVSQQNIFGLIPIELQHMQPR